MPIEASLLANAPEPFRLCPRCGWVFRAFMRGQVQRSRRSLFSWPPLKTRPYCALICETCKGIVGYEAPAAVISEESKAP